MKKLILILMIIVNSSICYALPQIITASGSYYMGENDSPKIAKDAARQEAMRMATEKAGVYVESYSHTVNMVLTADDVRIISGTILRVLKEEAKPEVVNEQWKYTVTLTCEVDTDKIDLQSLMENRKKLEELQQERDELKRQNELLLKKYQNVQGIEKENIAKQLENQYNIQEILDKCMLMVQQGEQQVAILELNKFIYNYQKEDKYLSYAYYLRGRAYYERNMDLEALNDFSKAETLPNSIYPHWRIDYYKGIIYSDRGQWENAYNSLNKAWNNCDGDKEVSRALQKAKNYIYSSNNDSNTIVIEDWKKPMIDVLNNVFT